MERKFPPGMESRIPAPSGPFITYRSGRTMEFLWFPTGLYPEQKPGTIMLIILNSIIIVDL